MLKEESIIVHQLDGEESSLKSWEILNKVRYYKDCFIVRTKKS